MYLISEFNERYPTNKHILHAEDSHLPRGVQQRKKTTKGEAFIYSKFLKTARYRKSDHI
jgi:hypothetical protein